MTKAYPIRRSKNRSEQGYVLLAVICMLALMTIALAVAMPRISSDIQRDREVETMHRGKQYIRAIQLYYRKFHAYPPSVDALVKTNNIRFLRKKYVDPTTRKEEWHPIMFGQNKTPMAMGFFGQPLGGVGGSVLAGTGPGGGNGLAGNTGGFGAPLGGGSSSLFPTSSFGNPTSTAPAAPGDPGTASSTTGGTDANGNSTTGGGTAFGGQTFGGGGIIGVSPASPKPSILVYKKKSHYNEWEFLYSPLSERNGMGYTNPGIVTPPLQGGAPGTPPSQAPPSQTPPTTQQ